MRAPLHRADARDDARRGRPAVLGVHAERGPEPEHAARASEDQAERVGLMQQVQENVNSAYTYVFLTHANWAVGFSDDVKNVCGQTGPGGIILLCNSQGRGFYHNVWIDEG